MEDENELNSQESDDDESLTIDDLEVIDEPEREVPESVGISGNLSEAEEGAKNVSDIQSILGFLHHQYKDKNLNEILQSAASGRTYPENVLDKNYGIVMSRIYDKDPFQPFDVFGLISIVQDGVSRGIEGRQRVEDLELAGVSNDKELEELSKKMGL
jgi:hypothetical protein